VTAKPTELPFAKLTRIGDLITREVPGVVSVTYNVTQKPPSTIEAIRGFDDAGIGPSSAVDGRCRPCDSQERPW
jgi:hypothetical protein